MFLRVRPDLCSWAGEGSRGCRAGEVLDSRSVPPAILLGFVFYSEQTKGPSDTALCLQTWELAAAPWTGGRGPPSEGAGLPLDLSNCTSDLLTRGLGHNHMAGSST